MAGHVSARLFIMSSQLYQKGRLLTILSKIWSKYGLQTRACGGLSEGNASLL